MVHGGRPDMAMYIFSDKIYKGEPISVFNHGDMQRDFTYVSDIIMGLKSSISNNYDCEIFNLGNNKYENIMDMICLIEELLGKKARIEMMDIQPGDVQKTYADIEYSKKKIKL